MNIVNFVIVGLIGGAICFNGGSVAGTSFFMGVIVGGLIFALYKVKLPSDNG